MQEHIPKEEAASEAEQWGFTVWEFIVGNWLYLLGIVLVLVIFLYARHKHRQRYR